jgi:hypothetical protein
MLAAMLLLLSATVAKTVHSCTSEACGHFRSKGNSAPGIENALRSKINHRGGSFAGLLYG